MGVNEQEKFFLQKSEEKMGEMRKINFINLGGKKNWKK